MTHPRALSRTTCSNTSRPLQVKSDTRLMFTSRFIADIQSQFAGLPTLEVRATELDVRRFVAGRTEYLAKCVQRNNDLQNEIEDKVSRAVDGM
ncbi:hypothetical protein EJ05DRAFT_479826 [Pseudovirgaria hyperparasitica]|uniref:Uncharacterized protein n=1 Tax=Pseudovirgaria hyperparasitica TaxID=470096 RepID=A0A6A6VYD8_9PEZI|nr:uncharacterized protein EJ05DRAFT_479826 [Pseudovirgaria hyperparasitica]KAF2754307.1 hypothetical protein EJ05DRAFT_479826 [Pseudovirgaria hyperparasitica]